jgi:hypothetical protein
MASADTAVIAANAVVGAPVLAGSPAVVAGIEPVSSSFGNQLAGLAEGVTGGVEFGLELWVTHAAGAGASCSRRWALGAPADVWALGNDGEQSPGSRYALQLMFSFV